MMGNDPTLSPSLRGDKLAWRRSNSGRVASRGPEKGAGVPVPEGRRICGHPVTSLLVRGGCCGTRLLRSLRFDALLIAAWVGCTYTQGLQWIYFW